MRIIFLIAIISISLLAFEAQEAFAAAPAVANSFTISTTTIRVCFDAADVDPATTANADFQVDFGSGFTAGITNTADEANNATCGGVNDSVLLTVAEFATDATPTIRVLANQLADTPGGTTGPAANADTVAADNVAPTHDSAETVTTTKITATFSESLTAGTVVAGDFTITNPSISVLSVSVNGAVVTLNTSSFSDEDTPLVRLTGSVDDASAATNTLTNPTGVTATSGFTTDLGSSSGDNSAPSMGSTGFNGVSTVDDGFSYNGNPTDVTGFKNDYPLIRTPVGVPNTLDVKIMENRGLGNVYFVSVQFGIPEGGGLGDATVTYFPNKLEKIKIDDPNNLLSDVSFEVEPVKCKANSSKINCFSFSMDHTFMEAPLHDVVKLTVADMSRNVATAYFNHGVQVYGDSLNPPVTQIITNQHEKFTPQITITQIDRELDLWVDENENQWTRNIMGSWLKITQDKYTVPDDDVLGVNGYKRIHDHFATYLSGQELIANQIWDSAEITSDIGPFIPSKSYGAMLVTNNSALELDMLKQIERANQKLNTPEQSLEDYGIIVEFSYTPIEIPDEILFVKDISGIKDKKLSEIEKALEIHEQKIIQEKFS